MAQTLSSATAPVLTGKAKLDDVSAILRELREDLDAPKLDTQQKNDTLERLKVYGRDAKNADPIFAKDGIETLGRYAFTSSVATTSREALRCLANALFLQAPTRQLFVDLDFAGKAAEKYKSDDVDDEFLLGRILFLLTYDTNLKFDDLAEKHGLLKSINQHVVRHSKRFSKTGRRASQTSPMIEMALAETLKLMFNITHFYPDLAVEFSKSIPCLFKILFRSRIPRPPLQPPINYIINALINLDLECKSAKDSLVVNPVFPSFDQKANAEHLVNILDHAVRHYPEAELNQVAAPLVVLIRRVYEFAPEAVKKYMQWLLLPTDEERSQPVGTSDTLSSRLLRLSTSALVPNLRESLSTMFFEISGKDATTFVQNVGYGFASGFLMSNNIQIPENAVQAFSAAGSDGNSVDVNPVTGQRLDAEPEDTGPPMTEEEKEREAERLFVLFERLRATGVVDVRNPVANAYSEGRFEELPD